MTRKNNHLNPIEQANTKPGKPGPNLRSSRNNGKATNNSHLRVIKKVKVEKENYLERIEKPIQQVLLDQNIDNFQKLRQDQVTRIKNLTKKPNKWGKQPPKASVDLVYSNVNSTKPRHKLHKRGESQDFEEQDISFFNQTSQLKPIKTPSKKLGRGGGGFSLKQHQMNAKLNLQNLGFYNQFSALSHDFQEQCYYSAQLTKNNSKSKAIEFSQTQEMNSITEVNAKIQEEKLNYQSGGFQTTKNQYLPARTFHDRKNSQQDYPHFVGIIDQDSQGEKFRSPTKVRSRMIQEQFSPQTLLKSKPKNNKIPLNENLDIPLMTITQPNFSQVGTNKHRQIHSLSKNGMNNSHRDSKVLLNKSFKALTKTHNFGQGCTKQPKHKCIGPQLFTQQLIGYAQKMDKRDQAVGGEDDDDQTQERRDTQNSEKYEFTIPQMVYEREKPFKAKIKKRNSDLSPASDLLIEDQVCYERC